jgi:hypothetical protein
MSVLVFAGALVLSGCASQIVERPIAPYVDAGITSFTTRTVAVVPFVIPKYLTFSEGGHHVSASMTNDLMRRLEELKLYHLVDPADVTRVMTDQVGPLSEWIFEGTRDEALTIARALGCDGLLVPAVVTYRQGNLIDSEVEIELTLLDVFSATTLWSIRENIRGKAGKESLNQPVRAPAATRLAQVAVEKAVDKIGNVSRDGADYTVPTASPRKIAGYTVLGIGVASVGVTGYYYYDAQKNYDAYKHARQSGEIRRLKEKVELGDTLWMTFGSLSLVSLGTATYLLVTDDPYSYAGLPTWLRERRVDLVPSLTEGGGRLLFRVSF